MDAGPFLPLADRSFSACLGPAADRQLSAMANLKAAIRHARARSAQLGAESGRLASDNRPSKADIQMAMPMTYTKSAESQYFKLRIIMGHVVC